MSLENRYMPPNQMHVEDCFQKFFIVTFNKYNTRSYMALDLPHDEKNMVKLTLSAVRISKSYIKMKINLNF